MDVIDIETKIKEIITPKAIILRAAMYLFLSVIVGISILPITWVAISSFKTNREILDNALSLPTSISFQGYIDAVNISPILSFFGNSLIVASASTVLNVLLIGMAAYVVARFTFRGKNMIIMMFAATLMLPMTALIQPVYLVIMNLGLYNTRSGLTLVYTALGLPTTFFVMRACFMGMPRSIEEAAYIDGAGVVYTFGRVVLPMARPGLASAAVIQFLMAWNEFLYALVLTRSQDVRTLPIALNYFRSQFSFNYTAMFAAIVMIVVPSIVVYVLLQEQVVGSLTSGAVKE